MTEKPTLFTRLFRNPGETSGVAVSPASATLAPSSSGESPRITLSAGKFELYRHCPRKYAFQYVERRSGPRSPSQGPSPHLAFDGILHQTMRDFFRSSTLQESCTQEKLLQLLDRAWTAGNFPRGPEEPVFRADAEAGLRTWFERFIAPGDPLPSPIVLDEPFTTELHGITYSGRFDRVDQLPDGTLEIIDYKSGKPPQGGEAELRANPALWLLFSAGEKIFRKQIARVTLLFLRESRGFSLDYHPVEIDEARRALLNAAESIFKRSFPPQRSGLCRFCDFRERCPEGRIPQLTASQITLFEGCPQKFRLKHIERSAPPAAPSPHLSFDRSLHVTLQKWFQTPPEARPELEALLEMNWIREGYPDAEEEARFRLRAREYLDRVIAPPAGLVATSHPVELDVPVSWTDGTIDLTVRVDRVDERPDGMLELIDYRTGRRLPDAKSLSADPGLMTMFLAGQSRWPGKVAAVGIEALALGRRMTFSPCPAEIEAFRQRLQTIVAALQQDTLPGNKGPLCGWCDCLSVCPDWPVKPAGLASEAIDVYRRRMRLSYSKMSLFENCPRAYRLAYIERIPSKPRPFFSFGTCIHEVFERLYDPESSRIVEPTLEDLLGELEAVWPSHRLGYESAEQEAAYKADAIRQLTLYHRRFIAGQPWKPAEQIEAYFELPLGQHAVMTGFIDRIDRLGDGTCEILDYKTEPTDRTQEEVDHDKQLTLYFWAAEKTLDIKVSKLSLYLLDHDRKAETVRSADDLAALENHVTRVVEAIRGETVFAPKRNKYCRSCDHLSGCPLEAEILSDAELVSMQKF